MSALSRRHARGERLPRRLLRLRDGSRGVSIEPFRLEVARPTDGPWLPALEAALAADGDLPLRWAIVEARGERLVIEGARWCSPSST
jgi:hypothetical protein